MVASEGSWPLLLEKSVIQNRYVLEMSLDLKAAFGSSGKCAFQLSNSSSSLKNDT